MKSNTEAIETILGSEYKDYETTISSNPIYEYISYDDNIPVSFAQINHTDGNNNVVVYTSKDYRNKRFGSICIEQIIDWWDYNKYKYCSRTINYLCSKDNIAGCKLAQAYDFYQDSKSKKSDSGINHYCRK